MPYQKTYFSLSKGYIPQKSKNNYSYTFNPSFYQRKYKDSTLQQKAQVKNKIYQHSYFDQLKKRNYIASNHYPIRSYSTNLLNNNAQQFNGQNGTNNHKRQHCCSQYKNQKSLEHYSRLKLIKLQQQADVIWKQKVAAIPKYEINHHNLQKVKNNSALHHSQDIALTKIKTFSATSTLNFSDNTKHKNDQNCKNPESYGQIIKKQGTQLAQIHHHRFSFQNFPIDCSIQIQQTNNLGQVPKIAIKQSLALPGHSGNKDMSCQQAICNIENNRKLSKEKVQSNNKSNSQRISLNQLKFDKLARKDKNKNETGLQLKQNINRKKQQQSQNIAQPQTISKLKSKHKNTTNNDIWITKKKKTQNENNLTEQNVFSPFKTNKNKKSSSKSQKGFQSSRSKQKKELNQKKVGKKLEKFDFENTKRRQEEYQLNDKKKINRKDNKDNRFKNINIEQQITNQTVKPPKVVNTYESKYLRVTQSQPKNRSKSKQVSNKQTIISYQYKTKPQIRKKNKN